METADIGTPDASGRFQVMPPLTDEEYAALREDIRRRGAGPGGGRRGRHRARRAPPAAGVRGAGALSPPILIRSGLTDDEKRAHALRLNLARRHLTSQQKREMVRAELRRDPDRSDREIGRLLGVSHPTVATVRRDLAVENSSIATDDGRAAATEPEREPEPMMVRTPGRGELIRRAERLAEALRARASSSAAADDEVEALDEAADALDGFVLTLSCIIEAEWEEEA